MDKFVYERVCAIALNRVFGFEPRIPLLLIDKLGSAQAVFELPQPELRRILGMRAGHYLPLLGKTLLEESEREYEWLSSCGMQFVTCLDADFPQMLRECEDPPVGIYVRSGSDTSRIFNSRPAISIVGTRDISAYGKRWCEEIVRTIACSPSKPVIVSGLAFGVDVTAHAAALACSLPTIAVIPTGIDEIYPATHSVIAEKIARAPCSAIITDYPPRTPAGKVNFLRRNRIIAALGDSTILVESKIHGGGMMTARLAHGYGRGVFALPGRIDDLRSMGCNSLLGQKIAEPITSMADLCDTLGLETYSMRRMKDLTEIVRERFRNDPDLPLILKTAAAIRRHNGISIDEICGQEGMAYCDVSRCTGKLECESLISIDLMQQCCIVTKFD